MKFKFRNGFKSIWQKIKDMKIWILASIALFFIIKIIGSIFAILEFIFISKIADEFIDTNIGWLNAFAVILLTTALVALSIIFPPIGFVTLFIGTILAIHEIKEREEELCLQQESLQI